jgi:hypothetical protein
MHMPRKNTVEISAIIPAPLYREFTDLLPIYGANKWFITRALTLFLEEAKRHPTIEAPLQKAVQRLIGETLGYEPDILEPEERTNGRN